MRQPRDVFYLPFICRYSVPWADGQITSFAHVLGRDLAEEKVGTD